MNVLVPIAITSAMIIAGTTIAEPAASETAWVSGGTYVLGDRRIRAATHRVYECVQAHTGRAALPEVDVNYWLDAGPSQRYAPFDWYVSTAAIATTSLTYVLQPGFFNAISVYGLTGGTIAVTVKDAPGGTTLYSYTTYLTEPPFGEYEYLFSPPRPITKLILTDIPISPSAELTITVAASAGAAVGIGMINCGDFRSLVGGGRWGGTEYGSSADPVSYSYIKICDDGTSEIKKRSKATNMSASVIVPQESGDYALSCIQEVLDIPVSWIATGAAGYAGLNVFGLGSGRVSYDSPGHVKLTLNVKGFI